MQEFNHMAKDAGIVCALITDAGRTTVEPGTVTCLGIGPDKDEKIDKIISNLKLLSNFKLEIILSIFSSLSGPIPKQVTVPGSTVVLPASVIKAQTIPASFAIWLNSCIYFKSLT